MEAHAEVSNVNIKSYNELSEEEIKRIKENEQDMIVKKVIHEDADGNVTLKIYCNEGVLIGTMVDRNDPTFTVNDELIQSNEYLRNKYVSMPTNE